MIEAAPAFFRERRCRRSFSRKPFLLDRHRRALGARAGFLVANPRLPAGPNLRDARAAATLDLSVDSNKTAAPLGEIAQTMARRLGRGEWIVLFRRGHHRDGNRVLPLARTPLVGLRAGARCRGEVRRKGLEGAPHFSPALLLQTLAITLYPAATGCPLDRAAKPARICAGTQPWIRSPMLADILAGGSIDVVIH